MLHSSICVFTSDAYVKFHVWRRKNKVSDCVKHPVMMQAVLFIILYPAAQLLHHKGWFYVFLMMLLMILVWFVRKGYKYVRVVGRH